MDKYAILLVSVVLELCKVIKATTAKGKKFCSGEKCLHYDDATKYGKKCYYGEPQCWRGWADLLIETLWLVIPARFKARTRHG